MYKLSIKPLMTAAVISSLLLTVRSFAASQIRIVVTLETTKPGVYRVTENIE
jgi:hypothetical protein